MINLRVISTRPLASQASWTEALTQAQFQPLELPCLTIEALSDGPVFETAKQRVLQLDSFQKLIFVSQNAVAAGVALIEQYWPQLPTGLQFFAVGAATARSLNRYLDDVAVEGATTAEMNSEALLAHPLLQQVDGEKLVIFRGVGGRTVLGETLQARGAELAYCELYRREVPQGLRQALVSRNLHPQQDILAIFSGETLNNFINAARDNLAAWDAFTVLVPGQRVAKMATAAGFSRVLVAENASEASMLATLVNYRNQEFHHA